jgi:ketosteroid isomerase-like protein
MEQNRMLSTIEKFIFFYNAFDINGMLSLLHNDIVFQNISDGKVDTSTKGKTEFQKLAEQSAVLFKSRQQKITNCYFEEDKAVIDIDYEGIIAADLPNGLKAGHKLELKGKSAYTFKDGLILELTDYS